MLAFSVAVLMVKFLVKCKLKDCKTITKRQDAPVDVVVVSLLTRERDLALKRKIKIRGREAIYMLFLSLLHSLIGCLWKNKIILQIVKKAIARKLVSIICNAIAKQILTRSWSFVVDILNYL